MALITVWNMANLVSTLLLDQPLPSFYTLSVAAGKKLLFWGLDSYFQTKGGKYYYIYKLSANYKDHKSLAQTLVKDAAEAYLPSPTVIPKYLWNSLPEGIASKALLVFTKTAGSFCYTVIQDPSSPALLMGASAEVIEKEVERQMEQYKYVNVNLNDVLENNDHNLKDLLDDWVLAEINHQNENNNNNNNVVIDDDDLEKEKNDEMININEITVNNQSITVIPNYLTKLQEQANNKDENHDENAQNHQNNHQEEANIVIITDNIVGNDIINDNDNNEENSPKENEFDEGFIVIKENEINV